MLVHVVVCVLVLTYICVRACVRVCVCVRVQAYVRTYVRTFCNGVTLQQMTAVQQEAASKKIKSNFSVNILA